MNKDKTYLTVEGCATAIVGILLNAALAILFAFLVYWFVLQIFSAYPLQVVNAHDAAELIAIGVFFWKTLR